MKCSVCGKEIEKSANNNFIVCDECDLQIKQKIETDNKVNDKKEKKSNKKIIVSFIMFLIISILGGFIVGLKNSGINDAEFKVIMALIGFFVFLVLLLIFLIIIIIKNFSKKNKKVELSKNLNENLLIKCKVCGNKISKNASTCPHCGEPVELTEEELNKALKEVNSEENWRIIGIIILVIFLIIIAAMNGGAIPLFTIKGEGQMTVEPIGDEDVKYDSKNDTYKIQLYKDDPWDY